MPPARGATLALAALLLQAPGSPAAGQEPPGARSAPAPAPEPGTLFLPPVRFEREDGSFGEAQRGLLFVPRRRSRSGSGILSVEFHRFPSRTDDPAAPPVFLLHGGPGFDGLELDEPGYYEENVAAMTRFADVVVVGQRGIGSSAPDTRCQGARALLSGMEGPNHTYDMPGWILNGLERIAADAEEAPEPAP